jgi:hypothetical protein
MAAAVKLPLIDRLNLGIIRREVAHYMFGYYAIRCWDSDASWHGVNRNSPYWSLFKNFASRDEKH